MSVEERPRPLADVHTAPYWAAAREHRLVVQQCPRCGRLLHPSAPCCPDCWHVGLRWREVSGRATITALAVVHADLTPGFVPPFALVEVALAEEPRVNLTANILGLAPKDLALGDAVHVVFEDRGGGVVVPQFQASLEDE